ncbi:sugar phosphate isomerase/epimerase family protein [Spirillospora sp. NPDC127200]
MSTPTAFGVDLITFYSPGFWSVPDKQALAELSRRRPEWFWNRLLDSAVEAGVECLELTFPPGDWRGAVAAFGSAAGFRAELETRGLRVVSGFSLGLARLGDPATADRGALVDDLVEYAGFLTETGADLMVAGLPMRRTRDAVPPLFVDLDYARRLTEVVHEVGAAVLRQGVRLALHTEAHSVLCHARDVDLFMTLADPLYVWFCPDTGHLALSGADPVAVTARHRDRVAIAHWKDATGPAPVDVPIDAHIHEDHQRYFRRAGAGSVDWAAWSGLVHELGIGSVTLLEIDAVDDPVAEIRAAREFVERVVPSAPAR